MPTTPPAERSIAISTGGRPTPASPFGAGRSLTSPARWRAATTLETGERDRPGARARSARLATPRCPSASMTRRRLASRSDLSEPSVLAIPAADTPTAGCLLSRLRRKGRPEFAGFVRSASEDAARAFSAGRPQPPGDVPRPRSQRAEGDRAGRQTDAPAQPVEGHDLPALLACHA